MYVCVCVCVYVCVCMCVYVCVYDPDLVTIDGIHRIHVYRVFVL